MSTEDIENRIRDTSHLAEENSDRSQNEDTQADEIIRCCCGNSDIATEGSAMLLNKCQDCFAELQRSMTEEVPAAEKVPNGLELATGIDAFVSGTAVLPNIDNASSDLLANAVTLEAITGALILAMSDSSNSCTFSLNGTEETFKYRNDPINGTKARKLFLRDSWETMFQPLYWYTAFGALISHGKTNLTPCSITLSGTVRSDSVVLYAILETMCNRPRYDGLCINLTSDEVFLVKDIPGRVKEVQLSLLFDREACDQ
jgi:hypothetical protein